MLQRADRTLHERAGARRRPRRRAVRCDRIRVGGVLLALLTALPLLTDGPARAADGGAPSSAQVNDSNNPLTPAIGVNLQDQLIPSYYGLDGAVGNNVLLRGIVPFKLGLPQIVRVTAPIVTSPGGPLPSTTGLGDINLFDILLFKVGSVELGVGPQLTVPSATDDRLGTGKWQAGAAAAPIWANPWGLVGGLITYQHSFAGDGDRPTQNGLQGQPFVIYNLPDAFYLRSTAIWNFDLQRGTFYIPFGLGAGKVFGLGRGTTLNAFVEPQYTVAYDGVAPQWLVFAGLNLQLPLTRAGTSTDTSEVE